MLIIVFLTYLRTAARLWSLTADERLRIAGRMSGGASSVEGLLVKIVVVHLTRIAVPPPRYTDTLGW